MAGEPAQRKKPGKHKAGSRPKGSRKEEQRRYQQKKAAKAKADQDPIELGVGGGGGKMCAPLHPRRICRRGGGGNEARLGIELCSDVMRQQNAPLVTMVFSRVAGLVLGGFTQSSASC